MWGTGKGSKQEMRRENKHHLIEPEQNSPKSRCASSKASDQRCGENHKEVICMVR